MHFPVRLHLFRNDFGAEAPGGPSHIGLVDMLTMQGLISVFLMAYAEFYFPNDCTVGV